MKVFKKLSIFLLLTVFAVTLNSCSGCDNENPRAKVTNMGTERVSVQVKTSGGNTENINNIEPDTSSDYRSYAPGEITYTIVIDNVDVAEKVVIMDFCSDYIITVDENNQITTTSTNRD